MLPFPLEKSLFPVPMEWMLLLCGELWLNGTFLEKNPRLGLRWSSSALFKDSCELEMKKGTLIKSWNKNNIFQSFNLWFSLSSQFHLLVYSKFWIWKFQRCLYLGLSFNRPYSWVVSTIGAVALRRGPCPKMGGGVFFHMYIYIYTLPETNIAPENGGFQ